MMICLRVNQDYIGDINVFYNSSDAMHTFSVVSSVAMGGFWSVEFKVKFSDIPKQYKETPVVETETYYCK